MNDWAQFYTPESAGTLLVNGMVSHAPATVVDIGVGTGELLGAAVQRWRQARLYAADIDSRHILKAQHRFPGAVCKQLDALHYRLPLQLGLEEGGVDIAVCNPPYLPAGNLPRVAEILGAVGLNDCVSLKRVTTDIVFIAQNLRLLRSGGELAVIVPDSLATQHDYSDLRHALMENHGLHRVVQLPDLFFSRTEARTHIFYLRKSRKSPPAIILSRANSSGRLLPEVSISHCDAIQRLDHSFHAGIQGYSSGQVTLRSLGADVIRGALTHSQCRDQGAPYFHTTDFKRFPDGAVSYPSCGEISERWVARPGDILLPRVGARCLHYAARVVSGTPVISDCVFRVRVAHEWKDAVWRALTTPQGVRCRQISAHGVCARVLSKRTLLDMPLLGVA